MSAASLLVVTLFAASPEQSDLSRTHDLKWDRDGRVQPTDPSQRLCTVRGGGLDLQPDGRLVVPEAFAFRDQTEILVGLKTPSGCVARWMSLGSRRTTPEPPYAPQRAAAPFRPQEHYEDYGPASGIEAPRPTNKEVPQTGRWTYFSKGPVQAPSGWHFCVGNKPVAKLPLPATNPVLISNSASCTKTLTIDVYQGKSHVPQKADTDVKFILQQSRTDALRLQLKAPGLAAAVTDYAIWIAGAQGQARPIRCEPGKDTCVFEVPGDFSDLASGVVVVQSRSLANRRGLFDEDGNHIETSFPISVSDWVGLDEAQIDVGQPKESLNLNLRNESWAALVATQQSRGVDFDSRRRILTVRAKKYLKKDASPLVLNLRQGVKLNGKNKMQVHLLPMECDYKARQVSEAGAGFAETYVVLKISDPGEPRCRPTAMNVRIKEPAKHGVDLGRLEPISSTSNLFIMRVVAPSMAINSRPLTLQLELKSDVTSEVVAGATVVIRPAPSLTPMTFEVQSVNAEKRIAVDAIGVNRDTFVNFDSTAETWTRAAVESNGRIKMCRRTVSALSGQFCLKASSATTDELIIRLERPFRPKWLEPGYSINTKKVEVVRLKQSVTAKPVRFALPLDDVSIRCGGYLNPKVWLSTFDNCEVEVNFSNLVLQHAGQQKIVIEAKQESDDGNFAPLDIPGLQPSLHTALSTDGTSSARIKLNLSGAALPSRGKRIQIRVHHAPNHYMQEGVGDSRPLSSHSFTLRRSERGIAVRPDGEGYRIAVGATVSGAYRVPPGPSKNTMSSDVKLLESVSFNGGLLGTFEPWDFAKGEARWVINPQLVAGCFIKPEDTVPFSLLLGMGIRLLPAATTGTASADTNFMVLTEVGYADGHVLGSLILGFAFTIGVTPSTE